MKNLMCYIDVNFTLEQDFDGFTDSEKVEFMENVGLMEVLFRKDMMEQLQYFSSNIKDLKTAITFEGAKED